MQWRAAVNARERQRSNMELALYYWATELQRKVSSSVCHNKTHPSIIQLHQYVIMFVGVVSVEAPLR